MEDREHAPASRVDTTLDYSRPLYDGSPKPSNAGQIQPAVSHGLGEPSYNAFFAIFPQAISLSEVAYSLPTLMNNPD